MALWFRKADGVTRDDQGAAGNPLWEHKFALILRHGLDKAKIILNGLPMVVDPSAWAFGRDLSEQRNDWGDRDLDNPVRCCNRHSEL